MTSAYGSEIKKTHWTVRELIAELKRLTPEQLDSPVVTSKYNMESKGFDTDAITEIVTGARASILPNGQLQSSEGKHVEGDVEIVILY